MCRKISSHFFLSILFITVTAGSAFAGVPGLLSRNYLKNMPLPVTYIYGYNNNLVIAQVINGRQKEVAYTSFESADKGYWTYNDAIAGGGSDPGRTGTKYYNLASGTINRSDLPAGKYLVSYWARGGAASISGTNYSLISETSDIVINNWTYHECICLLSSAGNIQLSGDIQIDELRLYPATAQMTTFTYNPLIGKTSETDINNITTYYEYDEFNRLKCVKDQYGSILKNYIYHLKNQL